MPYEERTLTRDGLYEDVWKRPVVQVAKDLGVSDVAVAKICRKLSVPLPPRGYWARLAAGNAPRKPSLPKITDAAPTVHTLRLWRVPADIAAREASRGERVLPPIPVSETLENPHPLVRRTQSYLNRKAGHDVGGGGLPTEEVLDVSVSAQSVDRAMRIMDALLKALEAAGYRVGVLEIKPEPRAWRPRTTSVYKTYVLIQEHSVEFGLSERFDTIEIPPPPPSEPRKSHSWEIPRPTRERVPNGRLMLSLGTEYSERNLSWADGKHRALEQCLATVVQALEDLADGRRLREIERRREAAAERERQRLRQLEEERQRRLKALAADLDSRMDRWSKATRIRRFVESVEKHAAASGTHADPTALTRWLGWARSRAESLEMEVLRTLPNWLPQTDELRDDEDPESGDPA